MDGSGRVRRLPATSVWHVYTPLAIEHGAVNLGQGFPDGDPPEFVQQAACDAIQDGANQYARGAGSMALVSVVAERASADLGRVVDPIAEVLVCNGCTGALFATFQALLDDGDEVVVFEPLFDVYVGQIQMAGGVIVPVPLAVDAAGDWRFDVDLLGAACSDRTRAIVVNNPHNPTGKVFRRAELDRIADVVRCRPRIVVVVDEVYEHLVYDGCEHVRFASLPGMWDRTLTLSSAGKTFSVTGWKIGWCIGPRPLVAAVHAAQTFVVFSVCTPLQAAVAESLARAGAPYDGHPSYFVHLRRAYERKRDALLAHLRAAGFTPYTPSGSFFVVADCGRVRPPAQYGPGDWALARFLTVEVGVACIPMSAFRLHGDDVGRGSTLLRFAFCKSDEALAEAGRRLLAWRRAFV
ncbi:Aminotransferase class I/classII domain-containing protein [Plasmodiophora brassicae]|uniref:Aminotransferase class I/classII large domain-containing protein n=1 Tax=Plasmodiophora brassicae TaxID=37360 RepID=A0A3P3YKV6_PLABS|nr:unnamed protein product [Plasmodiophora brassicae]